MAHFPYAPPFTGKLLDDIAEAPSHDDDHHLPQHHDMVNHSPPPYTRSTSSLGLGPSWPVSSSGRTRTLTHDEMTEWRRLRRDTGHLGRLALLRAGAVVEPFRPTPLVRHSNAVRDRGRGLAAAAAEEEEEEEEQQQRLSAGEETRGWMASCLWDWAAKVGNRLKRAVRFVFARRKRVARRRAVRDVQHGPKYDLFRDVRGF
ncbi:hypothetical protein MY11210_002919 [Beauveria gryllotalpidicola]